MKARYIFEQFDSPEDREKFKNSFSKADLAKMVDLKDYQNKFSYGNYRGKDSADLNQKITDVMYGDFDAIGFTEMAYKIIIKEIPQLKSFIINDEHFESKTHYLNLQKEIPLHDKNLDDEYSVKVNIWLAYNTKDDDILDYKENTFHFLFTPSIVVTRTSIGLHNLPDTDKKGPAFGDMKTCKNCSGEEEINWDDVDNDKALDNLMGRLNKILGGRPDKEDEHFYNKLKIKIDNITIQDLPSILPELKKNLFFFNKYVSNKYGVSIF